MNPPDVPEAAAGEGSAAGRVVGVAVAVVSNNQDPAGLGRVKLKFPWLSDADESDWARVAAPMAGKGRGVSFLPEVDDEVLVAFEFGDAHAPYVVGSLWNGQDEPPPQASKDVRLIKSRSGHTITLTDTENGEKIEIADKTGNNRIVIDTAANTITVASDKDITLSAPKGKITLDAQSVEIKSSADAKVTAQGGVDLTATGNMNVKGQMVNIN